MNTSARAKLVTLAEQMLAEELSFFEGAAQIVEIKKMIEGIPDRDPDFDVFSLICSETDHLPLKSQRGAWSEEALARLEPEFSLTESWARSFAPAACRNLVTRFRP